MDTNEFTSAYRRGYTNAREDGFELRSFRDCAKSLKHHLAEPETIEYPFGYDTGYFVGQCDSLADTHNGTPAINALANTSGAHTLQTICSTLADKLDESKHEVSDAFITRHRDAVKDAPNINARARATLDVLAHTFYKH